MHRWVVDTVAQLHDLREGVRREINARAVQHPDRRLDRVAHDLVLVASELATNGIRHGRPPTIVELLQDGARFLLTVADHDLSSEPRIVGDRPPGQGASDCRSPGACPETWAGTARTRSKSSGLRSARSPERRP